MGGKRIHYIDWLRVLAVLLLFPFHTLRVYNLEPFYVKGSELSEGLGYIISFIDLWHMPLLFLLAGASTFLALGKRTTGQYAYERVKRLLVPLVFGFFVLIPPQTWCGAQYWRDRLWFGHEFSTVSSGSFWEYLSSGQIFVVNVQDAGDYFGGIGLGHLWFILYLLLISLLVLPAVAFARRDRGRAFARKLARGLANPAWWLVPALLLWITEGLWDPIDKSFFMYLTYFLLGFIVISEDKFAESTERHRWWAIVVGTAVCVVYTATGQWRDSLPDPSWALAAANIAGALGTWAVIVGALGLGRRYLDRPSPALAYLGESSYPVYLLHQTVIVVTAFYIVQVSMAWPLQWLLLLIVAVALTFALYEVVRRTNVLRFCFGMRPKRP